MAKAPYAESLWKAPKALNGVNRPANSQGPLLCSLDVPEVPPRRVQRPKWSKSQYYSACQLARPGNPFGICHSDSITYNHDHPNLKWATGTITAHLGVCLLGGNSNMSFRCRSGEDSRWEWQTQPLRSTNDNSLTRPCQWHLAGPQRVLARRLG